MADSPGFFKKAVSLVNEFTQKEITLGQIDVENAKPPPIVRHLRGSSAPFSMGGYVGADSGVIEGSASRRVMIVPSQEAALGALARLVWPTIYCIREAQKHSLGMGNSTSLQMDIVLSILWTALAQKCFKTRFHGVSSRDIHAVVQLSDSAQSLANNLCCLRR